MTHLVGYLGHMSHTVGDHQSTVQRMYHSQYAVCWAPDPARIAHKASRRNCTRMSPSETGTTHTQSYQQRVGCPHHTARIDGLQQTRTRHRRQSTPDTQYDRWKPANRVHRNHTPRPSLPCLQGMLHMQSVRCSVVAQMGKRRNFPRPRLCPQHTRYRHFVRRSAETQQHMTDTCFRRCTRRHRRSHTHSAPRLAADPHCTLHTHLRPQR